MQNYGFMDGDFHILRRSILSLCCINERNQVAEDQA